MMKDTALLILAAGSSSRMGEPKQLLDVEGKPLIQVIIEQLKNECYDSFIVTGAYHEEIKPIIMDLGCVEIYNPSWKNGMGSSISEGVAGIEALGNYHSIAIIAADQIMVKSNDINNLLKIWRRHPGCIICAQYGKARGIPAIFPKEFFQNLIQLKGDIGARKIIIENNESVILYNLEEAQWDVDTSEDYKDFISGNFHENN